ncbi:DUF6567 family protein [Bacteroidota bacterium]
MKNLLTISAVIILLLSLNSCGISLTTVLNQNQNLTEVHLNSNNFKIVDKVSGSAEVSYVLIFGGMNKTQLFENAYADMVRDANLESGSKALINIVTEDHIGGVPPFYYTRTTTVSAHVIEFIR